MTKKKLHLVPDRRKTHVSDLSPEEEARALKLADIALHNPSPHDPLWAGERAKDDHRKLMDELHRAAERMRKVKRVA